MSRATRLLRGAAIAGVSATIAAGAAGPAVAAPKHDKSARPDCAGRGVPDSKISIQLYTLRNLINAAGATPAENLEEIFADLSAMGYRQVELYSLHGMTAEQLRALLDEYGLKATVMHTSINEATWDQTLENAKTLGLKYLGAAARRRTSRAPSSGSTTPRCSIASASAPSRRACGCSSTTTTASSRRSTTGRRRSTS